jgi:peptidoglycan/LPS O-acetylase OafA/YrhL
MAVGWVVLMPLLAAPIIWAVFIRNGGFRGDGSAMGAMGGGVPLGHLWFLYYLLLFYAVVIAAILMLRQLRLSAALGRIGGIATRVLMKYHATTVLMALPIGFVLATNSRWLPWSGIPSPIAGPVPQPDAAVAFGCAFLLGWLLYRQRGLLQVWSSSWIVHAILASVASAASLWMLLATGEQLHSSELHRLAYALVYAFSGWSWVVAITGFCLQRLSEPGKVWRYLADASYWMYLVHLPLVMALQVVVMDWPLHWTIKFPSIVMVTFGLVLVSYRYCVRGTFIGAWLNGRSPPR